MKISPSSITPTSTRTTIFRVKTKAANPEEAAPTEGSGITRRSRRFSAKVVANYEVPSSNAYGSNSTFANTSWMRLYDYANTVNSIAGGHSTAIYHQANGFHLNTTFPDDFTDRLTDYMHEGKIVVEHLNITLIIPSGTHLTSNTVLKSPTHYWSARRETQGSLLIDLSDSKVSVEAARTMNVIIQNYGTLYGSGGSGGMGGVFKGGSATNGGGGGGGQGGHLPPSSVWAGTSTDYTATGGQGGTGRQISPAAAHGTHGTSSAAGTGGADGSSHTSFGAVDANHGTRGGSVIHVHSASSANLDGFHLTVVNNPGGVMTAGGGGGGGGYAGDGGNGGANGAAGSDGGYSSGQAAKRGLGGPGGHVILWDIPQQWDNYVYQGTPSWNANTIINNGTDGTVMGADGTFN